MKDKICLIKKQMNLPSTKDAEYEFLHQTSYIILARILLTKTWEDYKIIEPPNTYNGGFKKYIEEYNERIQDVYKRALEKSQDIYFLFNPANPYLLLKLSDDLIIDILFQICKYDFNTLNYDILGYIYEDYLDVENRKKFGQYYTPNYVVNLILDRINYKAKPNKLLDYSILDPASGSGTFLLNAVQRILSSMQDGSDHTKDYKRILETKIFGSELMLFPYLLSEINILIQISSLIKTIAASGSKLNVFHVFPNNSFNLINSLLIKRLFDIKEDNIKGNNLITSSVILKKKPKLISLQEKDDLDFVVGNPPYVSNDTNPDLFREMRQLFTFCEETYFNKMDLLYWFIILGILKLKPGGKLSYITTRYWIDKGEKTGVEVLKKYILDYAYIREIIDLRNLTVFTSATGQENIIFILEKQAEDNSDDFITIFKILPRPAKLTCQLSGCALKRGYCINDQEYLQCLCSKELEWDTLLETNNHPLSNYIDAFKSSKKTGDLEYNRSWSIYYPGDSIIASIIEGIIQSCAHDEISKTPLGEYINKDQIKYIKDYFSIRVGVLTTIDDYFILTPEQLNYDNNDIFLKIDSSIQLGIGEKNALATEFSGEVDDQGYVWIKLNPVEKSRLINVYKTPSIYRHGLDRSKSIGKLVFFEDGKDYTKCPSLVYYLKQNKKEIEQKLEKYNELSKTKPNKWIALRRGANIKLNKKDRNLFSYYKEKPKIFLNYISGNDNIFGFTTGEMVATTDVYFFHKIDRINTYYILAYLNSKLMSFYFKERAIEIKRQKTNIENDVPVFIPRTDNERELQQLIIQEEKALANKLAELELTYRAQGFHYNFNQNYLEDIPIDLQTYLKDIEVNTINEKSYKLDKSSIPLSDINRNVFPIIIENPRKVHALREFSEIIEEDTIIFKYKSFTVRVSEWYYDRVKLILDSYIQFQDNPNTKDLLTLKIPSKKEMKEISSLKEVLMEELYDLSIEDKNTIEHYIEDLLRSDIAKVEKIELSTCAQKKYFIDLAFILMLVPKYKEFLKNY